MHPTQAKVYITVHIRKMRIERLPFVLARARPMNRSDLRITIAKVNDRTDANYRRIFCFQEL